MPPNRDSKKAADEKSVETPPCRDDREESVDSEASLIAFPFMQM